MIRFIAVLMLLAGSQYVKAQSTFSVQPLEQITAAVESFIMTQQEAPESVTIDVKSPDNRLRLRACAEPLAARWSPGSRSIGRVTVQVACQSPAPWRVHIQATVSVEDVVWALQRSVQRGDVLDTDLLQRKKVVLGSGNQRYASAGVPITRIESWLGFAFTQRVDAGRILTDRMLQRANLISKGEKVIIRHHSAGLQLQTRGVALDAAVANQRLQVRNTSSGKIVEAVAVARGLVDVIR